MRNRNSGHHIPFTPLSGLTLEVVSKMISDAASKRDDAHSKELAEKESLLIDQARRLTKLKSNLKLNFLRRLRPAKLHLSVFARGSSTFGSRVLCRFTFLLPCGETSIEFSV